MADPPYSSCHVLNPKDNGLMLRDQGGPRPERGPACLQLETNGYPQISPLTSDGRRARFAPCGGLREFLTIRTGGPNDEQKNGGLQPWHLHNVLNAEKKCRPGPELAHTAVDLTRNSDSDGYRSSAMLPLFGPSRSLLASLSARPTPRRGRGGHWG